VLKHIPAKLRNSEEVKLLAAEADDKICNIVQLIYHTKNYEGISKDFEFSRRTMEEHWEAGYRDAMRAMQHPEVLKRPTREDGVQVFDFSTI
jgi:NTE family protein